MPRVDPPPSPRVAATVYPLPPIGTFVNVNVLPAPVDPVAE